MSVGWISVNDKRKPKFWPEDENISEAVLLYVPRFRRMGAEDHDTGIRFGHYLSHSKAFRPDGSLGFEKEVTHWRTVPIPPKDSQ